jgi:lipopolysaccharide export system permease protein
VIIFKYILRDFLKYVLGTVVLALFLFVLFDFIHKTTKYFSVYQPSAKDVISLYAAQFPYLLAQALPIASLLGSVICMLLLSRTNEITSMRAAGMGPLRIGLPVAIGGLLLSLCEFGLGEFIVPRSAARMHYIKEVVIEGDSDTKLVERTKWLRSENRFFHFQDYDPLTRTMTGFRMLELGLNFRPASNTEAATAKYDPNLEAWELTEIVRTEFNPNGTIGDRKQLPSEMVDIPISVSSLKRERRTPREMSLGELKKIIKSGAAAGIDVTEFRVDFHSKIAMHLAAFVVSLIGIRFAYQSERTVESAGSILLTLGIGMSYWFVLSSARSYASSGAVHPAFAAWLPNFIVVGIAMLQIWKAQER